VLISRMSLRNNMIAYGAGIATLVGMVLLMDAEYLDGVSNYVSQVADSVLGESNILYEPIRSAFLTCAAPAGVVSGLTSLVLD